MKVFSIFVFVALLLSTFALVSVQVKANQMTLSVEPIEAEALVAPSGDHKLCGICVQIMDQVLQQLLNIILNGGVLGTCAKLCGELKNNIEQEGCDLICSIVGIDAFIHLIQKADLDPIWMCEEVGVCPVVQGGKVKMDDVKVSPTSGQQGTTFNIVAEFTVLNSTGTGELAFEIVPPQSEPFGSAQLDTGMTPGNYQVKASVPTNPTEQEAFESGTYGVYFFVCEGSCGSHHKNTGIYAQGQSQFSISGQ